MASNPNYRLEFTRLGRAVAVTRYGLDAVEARIREALDGAVAERTDYDIDDLEFQVVTMDGRHPPESENVCFVCTSLAPGVIRVDSGSFQEFEMLDAGPFKGYRLMMPVGDSDEDD